MRNRSILKICIIVVLGVAAGLLMDWQTRHQSATPTPAPPAPTVEKPKEEPIESTPEFRRAERMTLTDAKLMRKLRDALGRKDARPNELILGFKDAEALRRFLERAGRAGVKVLSRLDKLNLLRVKVDDLAAFEADLNQNSGDFADLDANMLVFPPTVPEQDERVAQSQVPFTEGLANFLGMTGDSGQWGLGVTVAVLDSGVAADSTFGAGKVRYLDVGMGIAPTGDDGHGTGVAALISGRSADAMGVAQGADILSIRVTAADGLSDAFTLTQAIMAAVDNGARVVNISLGAYSSSVGLAAAIDHAMSLGTVIVASAGNDQANQLTFPAAYAGVISVGSVDANGKQVLFSNSGDNLSITAPGYGVPTAWINNQRVYADGTSFSAPIVSGSIAALMSIYPGITATRAWEILQQTASDGGPAGMDPDYGYGTVNLMWAQHYNDPSWFDTAVSSHYVNPLTGTLDVVVQNRGSIGVSGMELELGVSGNNQTYQLPWMGPGSVYVTSMPINTAELTDKGRLDFKSLLKNPKGQSDAVPANNFKGSSLSVAK